MPLQRTPKQEKINSFSRETGLTWIIIGIAGLFFFQDLLWFYLALLILGIIVFAFRTKKMMWFVGMLEILVGIILIIALPVYSEFSLFWKVFWRIVLIMIGIWCLERGIKDIDRYYKFR